MEFQNRLYELRRKAGLSQEELANLLGVTRQAVQKWESGASRPDMENLVGLSRYFGVSLDYLISGREPPEARQVVVEKHYYHRFWQFEYKSPRTMLGLPLVHVCFGMGHPARGIFAVGNVALGVVSCGGAACGVLSLGGVGLGLIALGGAALGVLALGGVALGLLAWGGMAAGYLACGGVAWGQYAVGGVVSAAKVAVGSIVSAPLAVGQEAGNALRFLPLNGSVPDQAIRQAVLQAAAGAPGFVRDFLVFAALHLC